MKPSERRRGWDYTSSTVTPLLDESDKASVSTDKSRTAGPVLKIIGILLVAAFSWVILKHGKASGSSPLPRKQSASVPRTGLPKTIVLDEWWAKDWAVLAARGQCRREMGTDCDSQYLKDNAIEEEAQFRTELETAFQADKTCSGIKVSAFGGSAPSSHAAAVAASGENYWWFMMDFAPGHDKASWDLSRSPGYAHNATGEGTPREVAHTVCSIVNGLGASIE